MSLTTVTIAIPTVNRASSLAETLCSVRGLDVPSGIACDVLVVDNGSSDRTLDVVAEAALDFPIPIRSVVEARKGLCFGRNRALAEAHGEYVVFLDDDVYVAPTWISGCIRAVQTFDADCVVGPVFPIYPTTLPAYATDYVLGLLGSGYSRKGAVSFVLPRKLTRNVPGCNFAVRRDAALAIGAFNNTLGRMGDRLLAGEDSEFGIRLGKADKIVVYEPDCWIHHIIPAGKLDQQYLRRRAEGSGLTKARLRAMHGPKWNVRDWMKAGRRAIGLWLRWQGRRWSGKTIAAFEWELRTRRHMMELLGSLAHSGLVDMTERRL